MTQTDLPEFDPTIAQQYGDLATTKTIDFLGSPLWETESFMQLVVRFAVNMIICWIIIRYFYYRKHERKDFIFTFALFSVTIFLLIFLLNSVKLQIGMGLGLFAIFGILRYRTEQVSVREMTYLFAIIGISVLNGLSVGMSYAVLIFANSLFILTAALESRIILKKTSNKIILYEKIDLIKPEKNEELLADLKQRTGLIIQKVEVGHIDFLRDVAFLKVTYEMDKNDINTIDNITKLNQFV